MYSYDEVYKSSLKYFNNDELKTNIFISKYALSAEDKFFELSPKDMFKRLAREFARIEKNKFKNPLTEEEIYNLFDDFKYIVPNGSPLFGIGNDNQYVTLSNCYVLETPQDSYASIMNTDEQLVHISKRRGGVGIDISNIRPKNAPVKNAARTSTGIVSFMERYSNSIREVGQYGRRGALMLTCDIFHYDIESFITCKNDLNKITGANISVKINDKFMRAVENDEEIELKFPINSDNPIFSKKVKAQYLWNLIIKSAWETGEPGILFWDKILNESISDYYGDEFKTVCVNPCSEIPLSELDSCRLMAINLYSYVENKFTKDAYFDFEKFEKHVKILQRLMDDLIDLEIEKIDKILNKIEDDIKTGKEIKETRELNLWKKIKQNAINGRRTGSGIIGFGDTLAALNIRYDSDEALEFAEKLFYIFNKNLLVSSIEMAQELGPFPLWKKEEHLELDLKNPFLKRIFDKEKEILNLYSRYGRRNISYSAIAPTGSISILAGTTSGIEPIFLLEYKRRRKITTTSGEEKIDFIDSLGDKWQEYIVLHDSYKYWRELNPNEDVNNSSLVTYDKINPIKKIKLIGTIQKYISHSISNTTNLPENFSLEKTKEICFEAWKNGCKGITIYRENSRAGVLVRKDENKGLFENNAPKRPKKTIADVHHVKNFLIIIGFLPNDLTKPYEIFVFDKEENIPSILNLLKENKKPVINKIKRGSYELVFDDKNRFLITCKGCNPTTEALTRMVSLLMRHNIHLSLIISQLEKIVGFDNYPKLLGRVLKKYLKNGTPVVGDSCSNPECGSNNLVHQDGCIICLDCGFSKCN